MAYSLVFFTHTRTVLHQSSHCHLFTRNNCTRLHLVTRFSEVHSFYFLWRAAPLQKVLWRRFNDKSHKKVMEWSNAKSVCGKSYVGKKEVPGL